MSMGTRVCPVCQHKDDGSRRWFWVGGATSRLRPVCEKCVTKRKKGKRP